MNDNIQACRLLQQKGATTTMQIAENETILTAIVREQTRNHNCEYATKLNGKKIADDTIEGCIQKVIEAIHPKEIQLIPHSVEWGAVNSYLLLLKINK